MNNNRIILEHISKGLTKENTDHLRKAILRYDSEHKTTHMATLACLMIKVDTLQNIMEEVGKQVTVENLKLLSHETIAFKLGEIAGLTMPILLQKEALAKEPKHGQKSS